MASLLNTDGDDPMDIRLFNQLCMEVEIREGINPFLYVSRPGDGQVRYVFREWVGYGLQSSLLYLFKLRHREV